ncbi:STAS domain-containing protein [Massilia cavernae]|uniref:STAS domain-containing protein n=1 Tax=Massilia cavernae TaxID=2320864 RepID=A0A418X7B4_9BURK|nr:STAS domain-containing protein [Massilia cavernae]RJG08341.1 STAS domain-containing protein [Massilia cavernae]
MHSIDSITVENASAALERGIKALKDGQTEFDLGAIQSADSAAVAVLLAWKRAARKAGAELSFINIPETLLHLTELYGVDDFLIDSPADLHHH